MIGNLGLPDYVGDTASKVKTLTVAAFNSTTIIVSSHWNRIDKERFLQISNDAVVCINAARLKCRKLIGPKCRDHILREVSIRLRSCSVVKKYDFLNCLKYPIRSGTLLNEDPQTDLMLSKVVWILLQNSKTETDFRVHDDKIRAWNTRFNEENLIRKIGSPSSWDIFEADDKKPEMNNRMKSDRNENSWTRSFNTKEIRNNFSEFAGDTEGILTAGVGDGEPANETFYQPPERYDDAPKDVHGVLHSSGNFFKQDRRRPTPDTSKTDGKTRNFLCSRRGDGNGGKSSEGLIGNRFGHLEQSQDVNKKDKKGLEYKNMNLHSTPEDIAEKDGLTIHVPSNVHKIVLIKDGRKITVEL